MGKFEIGESDFAALIETWQFFRDADRVDLLKKFLIALSRDRNNLTEYQSMVEKMSGPTRKSTIGSEPVVFLADVEGTLANFKSFQSEIKKRVHAVGGVSAASSKVGISQPTLSRFLGMSESPRYATIQRIAKAFGVTEFSKTISKR